MLPPESGTTSHETKQMVTVAPEPVHPAVASTVEEQKNSVYELARGA